MCKSKNESFEQSYNAQAAVDAEGSALILSARVSQCATDQGELAANVEAVPPSVGKPTAVLADKGYAHGKLVSRSRYVVT